jgi:hypothetical protein
VDRRKTCFVRLKDYFYCAAVLNPQLALKKQKTIQKQIPYEFVKLVTEFAITLRNGQYITNKSKQTLQNNFNFVKERHKNKTKNRRRQLARADRFAFLCFVFCRKITGASCLVVRGGRVAHRPGAGVLLVRTALPCAAKVYFCWPPRGNQLGCCRL